MRRESPNPVYATIDYAPPNGWKDLVYRLAGKHGIEIADPVLVREGSKQRVLVSVTRPSDIDHERKVAFGGEMKEALRRARYGLPDVEPAPRNEPPAQAPAVESVAWDWKEVHPVQSDAMRIILRCAIDASDFLFPYGTPGAPDKLLFEFAARWGLEKGETAYALRQLKDFDMVGDRRLSKNDDRGTWGIATAIGLDLFSVVAAADVIWDMVRAAFRRDDTNARTAEGDLVHRVVDQGGTERDAQIAMRLLLRAEEIKRTHEGVFVNPDRCTREAKPSVAHTNRDRFPPNEEKAYRLVFERYRQFLARQGAASGDRDAAPRAAPKVFVAHSSQDEELGKAVAHAIRHAYNLQNADIRYTMAPEYGLGSGRPARESIRKDILGAKLFVLVLTQNVGARGWVPIETGAAWGTEKVAIRILLARGASFHDVYQPLNDITPIVGTSFNSVREGLRELGGPLGLAEQESDGAIGEKVNEVVKLAGQPAPTPGNVPDPEVERLRQRVRELEDQALPTIALADDMEVRIDLAMLGGVEASVYASIVPLFLDVGRLIDGSGRMDEVRRIVTHHARTRVAARTEADRGVFRQVDPSTVDVTPAGVTEVLRVLAAAALVTRDPDRPRLTAHGRNVLEDHPLKQRIWTPISVV